MWQALFESFLEVFLNWKQLLLMPFITFWRGNVFWWSFTRCECMSISLFYRLSYFFIQIYAEAHYFNCKLPSHWCDACHWNFCTYWKWNIAKKSPHNMHTHKIIYCHTHRESLVCKFIEHLSQMNIFRSSSARSCLVCIQTINNFNICVNCWLWKCWMLLRGRERERNALLK